MRCYDRFYLLKRLACFILLAAGVCGAADWPQWRGPFFNGSTTEAGLPAAWTDTNGITWRAALPGVAGSTPIVWGTSVFLTSPDANKNLLLMCIDVKTGRERWRRVVAADDRSKGRNNMASPSPITDGERVYVMFATGTLAAYGLNGEQKWSRDLAKDYGGLAQMWIYGASPLLYEGRLYIPMLQRSPVPSDYTHALQGGTLRESFLLCVDPVSGSNIWRHVRSTEAQNESMESYTTPIPRRIGSRTEILLLGANHLTAHDAITGEELWRTTDLNPKAVEWWRVVPSPVVAGDVVVVCAPRREPVFAIRPQGTGQLTRESIAWEFSQNPSDCPTPLFYNDMLFVLDGDRQVMTRLNPRTGERIWQGNLGVREPFRGSPLGADGKIYCVGESGTVVVLAAGDEFKLLATIPAPAGEAPVRSSMVAAQGCLFLRTAKHLLCIGKN